MQILEFPKKPAKTSYEKEGLIIQFFFLFTGSFYHINNKTQTKQKERNNHEIKKRV